jgi:hypothetical protein
MRINVDRKFSSLLDELTSTTPLDRETFLESRARQVIASTTHLINLIDESYDADTAEELKKRLLSSIRTSDTEKFTRKIRKVKEQHARGGIR